MKTVYKLIFFSLLFINCKAQTVVDISTINNGENSNKYFKDINNHFAKFIGVWENTTGNITFRVSLWKEEMSPILDGSYMDIINGSYQIIENAGLPSELLLNNSVKYYTVNGQTSNNIIWIRTANGIGAGGSIVDNCALPSGTQLNGWLTIKITNPGVSPSIAHWTVIRKGATFEGAAFTVPTDIILTKIN